jgi:hypothetical protein
MSSFIIMARKGLIFISGLVIVFLLYIFLFRLGYGVWYDFLYDGRLSLYGEKDLSLMFKALAKYILIGPFIVLLLIPAVFRKLSWRNNHLVAWILFLILISYQFYLNQYEHYYMLVLPPLVLLGGMMLDVFYPKKPLLVFLIILFSLLINEIYLGRSTKSMILSTDETLSKELSKADEINSVIQPNSSVYILGNVKYYYLCHLNSAVPEKFGYSYSNILTKNDLAESINAAMYVIVDKTILHREHLLIDGGVQIGEFIQKNKLQLYWETNSFLIYNNSQK